jgi:hypothetical protein
MDEIDYNALFDIETGADIPDNTPAEGQEAAQEAAEAQEQGENTSQPAEAQEKPAEGQEKATEGKKEQTPEERARQAEGRRRREAEEAGRRAAMEEMNAVISRLGFTDPTTGEAVDTAEKLKAYEAKLRKDRFAAGKPTEADIEAKVRETMQRQQAPQHETPAEDPRIRQELEQIRALDPEMTDLGTIIRSEAGPRFREYVRRGLGFLDAYKLAAEDRLASLRQGKAAEAARLQAASKDHLSGTKTQGTGAAAVPRDVEANYRVFFPDASAADIQRMYNADLKKYGKK